MTINGASASTGPIRLRHVLSVDAPGTPTAAKREQSAIIALGFDLRMNLAKGIAPTFTL